MVNKSYLLIAVVSLAFVGCGSEKGPRTVPAEGVVTLDGQPVDGAAVVFVSKGGAFSAMAMSDEEGKFSLDAFEYKTGAVPGEYYALVNRTVEITTNSDEMKGEEAEHAAGEEGEGGGAQVGVKNDMPAKYEQPREDFKFTIPEDGITDLKLELTSK